MNEETQKIIQEQFKLLPENIQTAIVSAEFQIKLREIAERHALLIDQSGDLEIQTTLVMMGLEPLSDFVENIQTKLGVSIIQAKEIAFDVSEHIFKPIRDTLQIINSKLAGQTNLDQDRVAEQNQEIERNKILNEIENPKLITHQTNKIAVNSISDSPVKNKEIETMDEVKYQADYTPKAPEPAITPNPIETKMAGISITSQKIIETESDSKLPPVEKKKPTDGIDPYREPVI